MPRLVICQSSATPSLALYWHIGETAMRLASSRSASFIGENRALVMADHMLGGGGRVSGSAAMPSACHRVKPPRPGPNVTKQPLQMAKQALRDPPPAGSQTA